jgi:hypothetical protein
MLPLVEELPFGLGDRPDKSFGCDDPSRVERVAARGRLVSDDTKVAGDAGHGVGSSANTPQLRVPRIAASATKEHGLRKQGFAPECYEAGGVEMAGMESPKTHEAVQRR